jgi:NADH dehydrogenase FAD-containing subunit
LAVNLATEGICPRVLIGGGEVHYRVVQRLTESQITQAPIVLVHQGNNKILPPTFLGPIVAGALNRSEAQLDLWSACERKGVILLEDECLNIDRDEKIVFLKNYGKLHFDRLSVESQTRAQLPGQVGDGPATSFQVEPAGSFLQRLNQFVDEVYQHCPREVRVVLTGWCLETIQLAIALKHRLQGICDQTDIVILEAKRLKEGGWVKSAEQKWLAQLQAVGVRVLHGQQFEFRRPQEVSLSGQDILSFDICIPYSGWRSGDFVNKAFALTGSGVPVRADLSDPYEDSLFLTGRNIFFANDELATTQVAPEELAKTLFHNLFREEGSPTLSCRRVDILGQGERLPRGVLTKQKPGRVDTETWGHSLRKIVKDLQQVSVEALAESSLQQQMQYQASRMALPWKGGGIRQNTPTSPYLMTSHNGFNSFGGYTASANKIFELCLLKCFVRGVKPRHLRFHLTLPKDQLLFGHHIFESTLKAIEHCCEDHDIELNGGDTFEGEYWHLGVTMGGEVFAESESRFQPHDYLLVTQPLGFGLLWAGRLGQGFDSSWLKKSLQSPLASSTRRLENFVEKWQPSGRVLVGEWGFLFHCLEKLPAHQQLIINFREVPRWSGVDQMVNQNVTHAGLDNNWERVRSAVAFDRSEVSASNGVMWDSLSQGTLVFGVRAKDWRGALDDLKQMGYSHAALVGCVRPKAEGHRIILSDWSPR